MDEDWEFCQDKEWDDTAGELIHSMLEGAAHYSAGVATLTTKDADHRPLTIFSVSHIGGFEIGVSIDAKSGDAIWGYRTAPERCDACGHRVEEGASHMDAEGMVLCDDCWPVADSDS